ncbi:MAG TPA: flavohemoglobin expression-modulating QEGLA motif protein [Pirellulaceae bacterium]|nr:flavohemoglobin expression-modulating QEGLA motif protein [Pirellulaceae bacterium]
MTADEIDRLKRVCQTIYDLSKSIRVLTQISWPLQVRHEFFANQAQQIPRVDYAPFEASDLLFRMDRLRHELAFDADINEWLESILVRLEISARMLSYCGTFEFFSYSSQLYGTPRTELQDESNNSLDLAKLFDSLFNDLCKVDMGAPENAIISSDELAEQMASAALQMFGDEAPEVQIVDQLSANALAGPYRIRIRRDAKFTDRDVHQLIHHESHVHVLTSLNGINQPILKVLGTAHPGTTRTQEGLAVFAEFITGSMDIERFRRLADRVIAIEMAINGADFLDIYQYFLQRTDDPIQSFESSRRVFRGGVVTGGAPVTKDILCLGGLLRVHNFLRTAVSANRADCIRLLFCGKLDIEDLPVLTRLTKLGVCSAPKYLPTWAKDMRFLVCYLAYSLMLNRFDLSQVRKHYYELLENLA